MSNSDPLGRVLVTGGAGFIGSALSHALAPDADRWVAFDNLHPQVHPDQTRPNSLHQAAELCVGDVTSAEDLDAVLADFEPDVVVHLAAETGTAQSLSESSRHGLVNVVGTTQLLDALTRVGHTPGHFVLSSSRAVYGEGLWRRGDGSTFQPGLRRHAQLSMEQWDHPDSRHLPNSVSTTWPAPVSVYGATKLAQEHILAAWAGSHDTCLSVLRLQNVYGPGQSLTNPYTGVVSFFSQLARTGSSIPLYEDGDITRDFVFIDDVIAAFAAVIGRPPADGFRLEDVGSGVRTTIRDLAATIAAYHRGPEPHVTGQFRDGDVRHAACSLENSWTDVDWLPIWNLQAGVAALQEWIEAQSVGTPVPVTS